MADAEGTGDALTSFSSPKNDTDISAVTNGVEFSPTEATNGVEYSPTEATNGVEYSPTEATNGVEFSPTEATNSVKFSPTEVTNGVEFSPAEATVDETVVALGSETITEEAKNEENVLVVVTNEQSSVGKELNVDDTTNEKENKGQTAAIEDVVEKVKDGNDKSEENKEERLDAPSYEKVRRPRKKLRGKKVAKKIVNKVESKDEEKNEEKVVANSDVKTRKPSKRSRGRNVIEGTVNNVESKDEDKPEPSEKKSSKKVESMGMIFMCSSKTKKDCYRYKVFGLPANKNDIVQKIYKGMRLFLFDCDLRLMYGIYKAAGPGGSNIEPKAFKSAFPSQCLSVGMAYPVPTSVRFTVLEDCLPLAEEKFKKVIKDNYFSRNKFDCQLNAVQVKNLCKLFVPVSRGSKTQKASSSAVAERHTGRHSSANHRRVTARGRDEERGFASTQERRHRERPPRVEYAREVAPPPRVQYLPAPAPAPAPLYAYEKTHDRDSFRQDPVLEHRGRRLVELERRHHDETVNHEAYISREREVPSYREPVYTAGLRPEYYPPASLPVEYRGVGREVVYRSAGVQPAEYRSAGVQPAEYRSAAVHPAEYRSAAVHPAEYRSAAVQPAEYRSVGLRAEYRDHTSGGLLAGYRAAGVPAERHAPSSLSDAYRSSAGALRDYYSTTMYRY